MITKQRKGLGYLLSFIQTYIKEYLTQPIYPQNNNQEQYRDELKRRELFQDHWDKCTFDECSKEFVKLFIEQLLTAEKKTKNVYLPNYSSDFKIDEENIDRFLSDYEERYPHEYLWKLVFYPYQEKYNKDALNKIIELNGFDKVRLDEFGDLQYFINTKDIVELYKKERYHYSFEVKKKILVQICYENIKGMGIIDELLSMDIDGWDLGAGGVPSSDTVTDLPKFYDYIVCRYRGNPLQLKCLSFHSEAELQRVVDLLIQYDQPGQFSAKKGYLLGYRKSGKGYMRFTAARKPFGENVAIWLRNFHIENVTVDKLVRGIWGQEFKNWESVIRRNEMLAKGCVNLCINGEQGLGKTTYLLAYIGLFYPWYPLRISEAHFELWARWRYPGRNMYTTQRTPELSEADGYNFSLRSSGLISIVAENREDETTDEIIKAGNRGNKCTVVSYHPNDPENTLFEIANSLLRRGVYSTLKEALLAAGRTIRCCIQLTKDANDNRYYNIYEFRPKIIQIPVDFKNLKGQERIEAFMETMYAFFEKTTQDDLFETVPIVEYDLEKEQYVVKNTVSDTLYTHMKRNMQTKDDVIQLKKIFRPEQYIYDVLRYTESSLSISNIEKVIKEHGIDSYTDLSRSASELFRRWKEEGAL